MVLHQQTSVPSLHQDITMIVCLDADNVPLQDALLQFVSTVLILDHPRLCKPLRTNIMVIKVSSHTVRHMLHAQLLHVAVT